MDIDINYEPATVEPTGEHDDLSVIPRCEKVAKILSPRFLTAARTGGVAIVTHGTRV